MRVFLLVAVIGLLAGCEPAQVVQAQAEKSGVQMRVQIPSREATADLSRVAVSNGVETWLAADNISLSFQQGVLVASRGLGFDLMAADADGTLAALAGQGEPVYRRQMRYLTGDHHSTYLMAGCSMKTVGTEVIGGRSVQRFEESCRARRDVFTNVFWRDASGQVVQSKQWVSPQIGYFRSQIIGN